MSSGSRQMFLATVIFAIFFILYWFFLFILHWKSDKRRKIQNPGENTVVKVYSEKPKKKGNMGEQNSCKTVWYVVFFTIFSAQKPTKPTITCFLRKCNLSAWVGLVKAAGMVVEAKFHYSIVDRRTETQHQVTSEGSSFVNKSTCNK